LTLFFTSDRDGGDSDIWTASRATTDGTFGGATDLAEVNSSAADVDPAISAQGSELFFSSNRGGSYQIWRPALGCP
jgi:Tol biopolymer transport system component